MARSMGLNPASMPFFPGALRTSPEDDGSSAFIQKAFHRQDHSSISSHSFSSSDYRSTRSSPSPPQKEAQNTKDVRQQPSPTPERDKQHQPLIIRQSDSLKPYPGIELRIIREGSMFGALGTLPERDERPSADEEQAAGSGHQTPNTTTYAVHPQQVQQQQGFGEPAPTLLLSDVGRSISGTTYSSQISSQESNNLATPVTESQSQSFEEQLRASPLFHDILDRLIRCEYASREIQRELSDLNRKVNILVERTHAASTQPEFKDPFAPTSNSSSSLQSRPSIGNIAPNQAAANDDISSISQRLNTLTSSVGQLLALQTQQMQQNLMVHPESRNSVIALSTPQLEIAPNQILAPTGISNPAMLGHGLPNRPETRSAPRQQNPNLRTWSSGNIELPVRPVQELVRQEGSLRDKRRSSGLVRRDSASVFEPDAWSGSGSKENGPVITKWEQLNLAPELLRSITKFGVGPPNKIQQRALPFLLKGADIIAQAPPTQERIAAYIIPAIQIVVTNMSTRSNRGPVAIIVSTTLDQATQAQRMIRDLGGPIGVKSALGVGTTPIGSELAQELRLLQQNMPHIICGTPQKLHALFTAPGGLSGSEVRFLVLDEVDQLIARNLHEFVFNIVKLFPSPRSRSVPNTSTPVSTPSATTSFTSPFESGNSGRRFSAAIPSPGPPVDAAPPTSSTPINQPIERQTALFSNTVPQDVLNLATAIQLREPVRVLVRRDGNVSNSETNQGSRGLRQYYLYLAFQAGGRSDPSASVAGGGLGIIGSGRSSSNAETTQAREWKLDALADLLDDVEITHAVVHVGGMTALDAVVYKLASRGFEPIPLHGDMNNVTRLAAINKFRTPSVILRHQPCMKVLAVYDIQLKNGEAPLTPLVINYDLPKAVEEYSHRVAPAISSNYSRAGVVVNFVTATGGDVEMLRSIECYYKIKCPEVPMSLRDIV